MSLPPGRSGCVSSLQGVVVEVFAGVVSDRRRVGVEVFITGVSGCVSSRRGGVVSSPVGEWCFEFTGVLESQVFIAGG